VNLERTKLNVPIPFLHFCDYLHFEEDMALNMNNLKEFNNYLYPTMICSGFHLKWPAGSGEGFFVNMIFLIVTLQTPGDRDLNKRESTLYQKAFM
jgi:hypothetical protein